jgi:hypothetical protein
LGLKEFDLKIVSTSIIDIPETTQGFAVAHGWGSGNESGSAERRAEPRRKLRLPAWISGDMADRGSLGYDVLVSDASTGGVGFRTRKRLTVGAQHWIVCDAPHLKMSTRLRVVSCRRNAVGGFDVGAAFF